MKRCVIILPYFGKFNNYFPLFLRSCAYNKDFDWLIFTDDKTKYDYPENVFVNYVTFEKMQKMIKETFPFKVCIEQSYKLCDYKATYGLIFSKYIGDYEFWGFCDCDLIFGDLKKFITDDVLKTYDRIFSLGHLSLFRNNDEINKMCLDKFNGIEYAKRVLRSSKIYGFDEMIMNDIMEKKNKKIYAIDLSANISVYHHKFHLVKRDYSIKRYLIEDYITAVYYWEKGHIVRYYISDDDGLLTQNEFPYIHLQQRKMNIDRDILEENSFQILPNRFKKIEKVDDITQISKCEFDVNSIIKCSKNLIKWKIKKFLSHKMPGKFLRGRF